MQVCSCLRSDAPWASPWKRSRRQEIPSMFSFTSFTSLTGGTRAHVYSAVLSWVLMFHDEGRGEGGVCDHRDLETRAAVLDSLVVNGQVCVCPCYDATLLPLLVSLGSRAVVECLSLSLCECLSQPTCARVRETATCVSDTHTYTHEHTLNSLNIYYTLLKKSVTS